MLDYSILLSDFSQLAVSAKIHSEIKNIYHIYISGYGIELILGKDKKGGWKYLSPFQPCHPNWLKEIIGQIETHGT